MVSKRVPQYNVVTSGHSTNNIGEKPTVVVIISYTYIINHNQV